MKGQALKFMVVSGCVTLLMAFGHVPFPEGMHSSPEFSGYFRMAVNGYMKHRRYVLKSPGKKADFLQLYGSYFVAFSTHIMCDYGEVPTALEELENSPALLWIPMVERDGKQEKWMKPGPTVEFSPKAVQEVAKNSPLGTVVFSIPKSTGYTDSAGNTVQERRGYVGVVTRTPWRESQGASLEWVQPLICEVKGITIPQLWTLSSYLEQVRIASVLYFAKTGKVAEKLTDLDEAVGRRNPAAKVVFDDPAFQKMTEEFFRRIQEPSPLP